MTCIGKRTDWLCSQIGARQYCGYAINAVRGVCVSEMMASAPGDIHWFGEEIALTVLAVEAAQQGQMLVSLHPSATAFMSRFSASIGIMRPISIFSLSMSGATCLRR